MEQIKIIKKNYYLKIGIYLKNIRMKYWRKMAAFNNKSKK